MTEDIQIKALKVVLLSQLLVEAIDDVRGTTLYKGKAKQYANTLANVLTPMLKTQVANVYNEDPELTTNMFNELDALIEKMSNLNVVDLTMLHQIYEHYSANKEEWQAKFKLEFNTLKN